VPTLVRSILAIVVGFLFIGALAFGAGAALQSAGIQPPADQPMTALGPVLLETLYVAIFAIAGCWLAARLAPSNPMAHALILGALGLAFNIIGAVATWGLRPSWSILLNLALVMPYAWIGGRLRERQLEQSRTATV